jgi:hypothetical protein
MLSVQQGADPCTQDAPQDLHRGVDALRLLLPQLAERALLLVVVQGLVHLVLAQPSLALPPRLHSPSHSTIVATAIDALA